MPSILLINPNTSARSTEMMVSVARPLLPAGFSITGTCAAAGAAMIVDEEALAAGAREVVRIGSVASGFDAIVVAAFGDPGAVSLRDAVGIPVIGIAESALREAAADGRRFGIATTTPKLVRAIEGIVRRLGLDRSFTGVRVPDGDPHAFAADPARQDDALAAAAIACVETDGAEVVVIGGGPLSATAARLRGRLGPVIVEPVPAAMRAVMARLPAHDGPVG